MEPEESSEEVYETLDVTELVRRVPPFEQRLGVTINGLFAYVTDRLTVNGELQALKPLETNVEVVVDVVDAKERLVATTKKTIWNEHFCDFETFSIEVAIPDVKLGYIRVYPKPY